MSQEVLLLDDDANFRSLVLPALKSSGLTVIEATKGRDAMAELPKHDFAVLIVDGLLPDTSGIKWITKLREQGMDVPVIFVSAFYRDLDSYKRLTQDLGVAEVIHKPLEPETLAKAVTRFTKVPSEGRRRKRRTSTLDLDADSLPELEAPEEQPIDSDVLFVPSDDDDDDDDEAALRRSYEDVLPHILGLFLGSLALVRETPKDAGARDEAIRQSHDLAGTAGSYGFDEAGRAAGMIERELRRLSKGHRPDWAAFDGAQSTIRKLFGRMQDAFGERDTVEAATPQSETRETPETPAQQPTQSVREPSIDDRATSVDAEPRRRGRLPSSAIPAVHSQLLGPRLLIVDDDDALVDYIATALEGSLVALSTATTLEAVKDRRTDLDAAIVGMPFGSPDRSAAVIEMLKQGRRALPVAVLALDDSWKTRQRAVSSNADLFLAHPLGDRELTRALRRLESLESTPPRVLVHGASDCSADLGQAGMWVRNFDSIGQLLESVRRDNPDVVVVGGPTAREVAQAVRMTEGASDLAVLAVNAKPEVVEAADALMEQRSLWVSCVAAHARRAAARRRHGSDERTGLPHRSELVRSLGTKLAEALRHKRSFSLAILEIDGWDHVAREHGTPFAERIAAGVAKLAAARFRVEDVRGIWSRGLLVCGFADTDPAQIAPAINRLQREAASLAFRGREDRVRVTVSAGIASAPHVGEDLRSLVLVSEGRLRLAQKTGTGGLVWTG